MCRIVQFITEGCLHRQGNLSSLQPFWHIITPVVCDENSNEWHWTIARLRLLAVGPLSQEMEVAWRNLVRPQTGLPGPRDVRLIFQHLHALTISHILKYKLICESLVSNKRRRWAEMAALTITMLVSSKTRTKGGGHHVLLFLIYAFPFKIWSQMWGASMYGESNKSDCFNNLI